MAKTVTVGTSHLDGAGIPLVWRISGEDLNVVWSFKDSTYVVKDGEVIRAFIDRGSVIYIQLDY